MSTTRLIVIGLLALRPIGAGAQAPIRSLGVIVFAPSATRTVTVSKGGTVVTAFEVPKGNWLRVTYDDNAGNVIPAQLLDGIHGGKARADGPLYVLDHDARLELHGDVTLQARPMEAVTTSHSSTAESPVSISARGVDVVVSSHD